MSLRERLERTVAEQRGVLGTHPAVVRRGTYCGRGILGRNRSRRAGDVDDRGYLPVEWWIMSQTPAVNPMPVDGEGITGVRDRGGSVHRLDQAVDACGTLLFGNYVDRWPLFKLLDIGGDAVQPDFADTLEAPPIPAHVHGGSIADGRARGTGKWEAYFFPPTDVGPTRLRLDGVKTRLGLNPQTTREAFTTALLEFGVSDRMYTLLNEYPIAPYEGWDIPPGVVHAPGPWPTLEVQTPQDDFNLAAWQLGQRLDPEGRAREFKELVLRGLRTPCDYVSELVDWRASTAADFQAAHHRRAAVLEDDDRGRRLRIFFDPFDAEALEVRCGKRWTIGADDRPVAVVVWAGSGTVNGMGVDAGGQRECLVTPGHGLDVLNTGAADLVLLLLLPLPRPIIGPTNPA